MSMKKELISKLIGVEGGYVNDPSDSGGETNWGITKETAVRNGYLGEMRDMQRITAFDIYADEYWNSINGDGLFRLSKSICEEVFDAGVNASPVRAARMLQRVLNVMNDRQRLYSDIVVDGIIGNVTLTALSAYLKIRSEKVLLKGLNCLQGNYYIQLSENREKDERFIYGWLNNRVEL